MNHWPMVGRLAKIKPSQIREMMRLAKDVGAINMAQGAPDFPAAAEIKIAAIRAIADDHNQYTVPWGLKELRDAVAHMLHARFGMTADPDTDLTITCGVSEALVAVMLSIVEPGDEVIIVEPAHENYVPAVLFAGGVPTFVPLRAPEFALIPAEVEKVITKKTRALILNSPHNPSGRVFSREELAGIAALAEKHGFVVVTDEIYDQLTYDGRAHIPFATLPGMAERTITTGGISKIFAVTGWRLGYIAAPTAISAAIRTTHDYLTICAPAPFQHAAVTALGLPESFFDGVRADFLARREGMMAALSAGNLAAQPPEGAYYVLADFSAWGFDGGANEFCKHLILNAGVATVPGPAFYLGHPELGETLVRFAFAKQLATLDAVRERLAAGWIKQQGRA